MSDFVKDWLWRIVRTGVFTAAGVVVTGLTDLSTWWSLPIAAVLSLLVSWGTSATSFGAFRVAVEKGGWTLAFAALSVVPVELWGMPAEFVPLSAAFLTLVKGAVAKHVGDPNTAAIP